MAGSFDPLPQGMEDFLAQHQAPDHEKAALREHLMKVAQTQNAKEGKSHLDWVPGPGDDRGLAEQDYGTKFFPEPKPRPSSAPGSPQSHAGTEKNPQQPPTPQSHSWSLSALQKANPGQNAEAMMTKVKADGYEVVP